MKKKTKTTHLLELNAPQPCASHALTLLLWWPAQRTLHAPTSETGGNKKNIHVPLLKLPPRAQDRNVRPFFTPCWQQRAFCCCCWRGCAEELVHVSPGVTSESTECRCVCVFTCVTASLYLVNNTAASCSLDTCPSGSGQGRWTGPVGRCLPAWCSRRDLLTSSSWYFLSSSASSWEPWPQIPCRALLLCRCSSPWCCCWRSCHRSEALHLLSFYFLKRESTARLMERWKERRRREDGRGRIKVTLLVSKSNICEIDFWI